MRWVRCWASLCYLDLRLQVTPRGWGGDAADCAKMEHQPGSTPCEYRVKTFRIKKS